MKKKILSFCLAFALIVPAIFLFSACGDGKDTTKKERVNTAEIIDIYQDSGAGVYVEVTNFEHADYEYISNSGYNACTLEFSINDGAWFYANPVEFYYEESGVGIYQILSTNYQYGESEITHYNVIMTGHIVSLGEITVSVRIPESDTYYASAGSEKQNYTLKQYIQTALDVEFKAGFYTLGAMGYSDTKEERYAFYQDSDDPYKMRIGKFYSVENTDENNDFKYRNELNAITSEEETAMFAELNLEYKVVTYNSKYITSYEGDERIDDSLIETYENECVYNTKYWSDVLNLNQNYIWTYESNGWENKSVVFLVRQKADENTIQSRAFCYEVYISSKEIVQQTN